MNFFHKIVLFNTYLNCQPNGLGTRLFHNHIIPKNGKITVWIIFVFSRTIHKVVYILIMYYPARSLNKENNNKKNPQLFKLSLNKPVWELYCSITILLHENVKITI